MHEVLVPDIGDFKQVEVIEILVKPGDSVANEQSLITLESDKATMEIPSPDAGVVRELKVKVGDKVSQGSVILLLEGQVQAKPRRRSARRRPRPRRSRRRATSIATWSSSAPGRAATQPPSVPPTWG
jgi:pyruvate/2-oxoglutarate dehydrogenase complex dihydrolipoamide acyltransferase (E2) component